MQQIIKDLQAKLQMADEDIVHQKVEIKKQLIGNAELELRIKRGLHAKKLIVDQLTRIREMYKKLVESINTNINNLKIFNLQLNEAITQEQQQSLERIQYIAKLENTLTILDNTVTDLKRARSEHFAICDKAIESQNRRKEQMLKEIKDAQLECDAKREAITIKEKQLEDAKQKTMILNHKLEELKEKLVNEKIKEEAIKNDMEINKNRFENDAIDLRIQFEEENDKMRSMNNELLYVQKRYSDHKRYNETADDKINAIKQEIEAMKESKAQLNEALQKEQENYALKCEALTIELEEVLKRKDFKQELGFLTFTKFEQSEKKFELLQKEVEKIVKENDENATKNAQLNNDIAKIDKELLNTKASNDIIHTKIANIQNDINILTANIEMLKELKQNEEIRIQDNIKEAKTILENMKIRYEDELNSTKVAFTSKMDTLNSELEVENKSFTEEKASLESTLDETKSKIKEAIDLDEKASQQYLIFSAQRRKLADEINALSEKPNLLKKHNETSTIHNKRIMDHDEQSVSSTEGAKTLAELKELRSKRSKK